MVRDVPLRFLAIELGPDGVAEWGDRAHAVFVPRAEIAAIEVRHGLAGVRPVLHALVGVAILVGAVVLAVALGGAFDAGFSGGAAPLSGACVPLVLLGAYVVWFALRPTLHLRVRTRRGACAMRFHGETDLESIATILAEAQRRYGYVVRWIVLEPRVAKTAYRSATSD